MRLASWACGHVGLILGLVYATQVGMKGRMWTPKRTALSWRAPGQLLLQSTSGFARPCTIEPGEAPCFSCTLKPPYGCAPLWPFIWIYAFVLAKIRK